MRMAIRQSAWQSASLVLLLTTMACGSAADGLAEPSDDHAALDAYQTAQANRMKAEVMVPRLAEGADLVVDAEVTSFSYVTTPAGANLVVFELLPTRVISGTPQARYEIWIGGEPGVDGPQLVSEAPRLRVGQKGVFFLETVFSKDGDFLATAPTEWSFLLHQGSDGSVVTPYGRNLTQGDIQQLVASGQEAR